MGSNGIIGSILSSMRKVELEDLATIVGRPFNARMRKEDLVASLALYMTGSPEEWLSRLMERDLRLLKELAGLKDGEKLEADYPDYPSIVEAARLVETDESDEYVKKLWLQPEIRALVAPHLDKAIADGESSGRFELERLVLGYANLYGILPYERLTELVIDFYDQEYSPGDDYSPLVELLQQSPVLKLCRWYDGKDDIVCSPCVPDVKKLLETRGLDGDFKTFTHEDALEAGECAPDFAFGYGTTWCDSLESMLSEIGYEEDEYPLIEHDIWMSSQSDEEDDVLYDIISSKVDWRDQPRIYNECLGILSDYADHLPKWELFGWSASEKGMPGKNLFLDTSDQDRELEHPHWDLPSPTVTAGFGAFIGLSVPHVSREDPCPCGSGLKYGHCHGKYLS